MRRLVIYHSAEWAALVEQGWVTMTVEPAPYGVRIAEMIYHPTRRWY